MKRVARIAGHLTQGSTTNVSGQCGDRKKLRLEGRSCIITGAGSGIGRSSALLFAQEGASLVVADWNEQSVQETAELIRKECKGVKVVALGADCGSEQANERLVAEAVSQYGRLDVFYANAGVGGIGTTLDEISEQNLLDCFRVNVFGVLYGIKHASAQMIKQGQGGGSIICTSSVAGIAASAGPIPYAASKASVISIVQNSSMSLAGTNVRVNAICPGLVPTGMTKPLFDIAQARGTSHKIGQLNMLRRPGAPEEIANVALFLASDESSYIVGQAIPVCGGLSASLPFVPGGQSHRPTTGSKAKKSS